MVTDVIDPGELSRQQEIMKDQRLPQLKVTVVTLD